MARARRLMSAWGAIALAAIALPGCPGSSPTEPTQVGVTSLAVACQPPGAAALPCTASTVCADGPCPTTLPPDVTSEAVWETGDPSVARVVAPGLIAAVAPGDTFVRAGWRGAFGQRTITVLPGLPPQPTAEISGTVFEAGTSTASGAITAAEVEVIGGPLAGRTATTGVAPALPPGFVASTGGPGTYRLVGVPPGTYHIRVSKAGYAPQVRDVVVQSAGRAAADFALVATGM